MYWKSTLTCAALLGTSAFAGSNVSSVSISQALEKSYAPVKVTCPTGVKNWIRNATSLNPDEEHWVHERKKVVVAALDGYLTRLQLEDFDVGEYICLLRNHNYINVPTLGIGISGGGWASAFTGSGALRALDNRLQEANNERTGGLLQSLTYVAGLSGGSWDLMSLIANDFSTLDDLSQSWQPQIDRLNAANNTKYTGTPVSIFENIAAKLEAGFNVSVSDYIGRAVGWEFLPSPLGGLNVTVSGLAELENFKNHQMPFPIFQSTSAVPTDREYYTIYFPYANTTIHEFNPFEFGTWDPAAKAFVPMKYLGTTFNEGYPVYQNACVLGFDRSSFVLGTVSGAFNAWYIEDLSNGTEAGFSKRTYIPRTPAHQKSSKALGRRAINPEAAFNESIAVELIQEFNQSLGLSEDQVMYAWYPNPFYGLDSVSSYLKDAKDLMLLDGAENGQALPLASLVQPSRKADFIIAWDDNQDAPPYFWKNGTNLYDTYKWAQQSGIPFPVVPSAATFIENNYTTQPVFFGCDAKLTTTNDTRSPIVAYFANAPYSAYSNMTYVQTQTSWDQLQEVWTNSFNQITQGNGTLDSEWAACLGCASIDRSMDRLRMKRTMQCQQCFDRYCWDGVSVPDEPTVVVDPSLVLDSTVSFDTWLQSNPYNLDG